MNNTVLFSFTFLISFTSIAQENSKSNIEENRFFIGSLEINKKENDYSFKIKNPKILDGFVKENHDNLFARKENNFLCYILNENKEIIDSLGIGNPLEMKYEYNNEHGEIQSKMVNVVKNEIIIRFQFLNEMKYINISKTEENGVLRHMITLPLPKLNDIKQ